MAGTIKANTLQLGDSGIADNNFHLKTNVDGSLSLNRGNDGASTQEVLSITGTETVQRMMTFTALTATGTSVDFTGIPSWAKEITVMFDGVSLTGTSNIIVQLGVVTFVTSGYVGAVSTQTGGTTSLFSTGFLVTVANLAADSYRGQIDICKFSSNVWSEMAILSTSNGAGLKESAGSVNIGGTLDRIRVTTVNGTDTFDAGSINILVKG
jgi:hypothetical protein